MNHTYQSKVVVIVAVGGHCYFQALWKIALY